jgi:hypothetical protein
VGAAVTIRRPIAPPRPWRRFARGVLVMTSLLPPAGWAEGPWLARVVRVDAVAGVVEVIPEQGDAANGTDRRSVLIQGDELPAGVAPGRLVRVWPQGGEGAGPPRATLSPVQTGGLHEDRTGVRARLGHGAWSGGGRGGGHGGR